MKKSLSIALLFAMTALSPAAAQDKVLRIASRQLVAYQFGQPLTLDKQHGTTYTATRFERLPLPFAPLTEGQAAAGQAQAVAGPERGRGRSSAGADREPAGRGDSHQCGGPRCARWTNAADELHQPCHQCIAVPKLAI
mgnify:CR=1 FL=1